MTSRMAATTSLPSTPVLSELVAAIGPSDRELLRRYLVNAVDSPSRRRVRGSNRKLATLLASKAGAALFASAGWAPCEDGETGEAYFAVDAIEPMREVLAALDVAVP